MEHAGQESVLSAEQAEELKALKTEHLIVSYLTPRFEEVFKDMDYRWIVTDGDSRYNQKPDLFLCHDAVYTATAFASDDPDLIGRRRDVDKYGFLSDRRLR